MWCISATRIATTWSRRGALTRDSGLSFIKIGIFHQDWYQIVLYLKSSPLVKHQYVDIEYMRNKKDMHFNRILEACDLHGITDMLQFRHNWNQEIISESYSTLFYDKKERIFTWMTNGRRFHVKLAQFAQILGLSS
jgi:hypothetical protein